MSEQCVLPTQDVSGNISSYEGYLVIYLKGEYDCCLMYGGAEFNFVMIHGTRVLLPGVSFREAHVWMINYEIIPLQVAHFLL